MNKLSKTEQSDINFLLACNSKQFDDWFSNIDDDDALYALDIIKRYKANLYLELYNLLEYNLNDYSLAVNLLDQIKGR